MSGGRTIRIGGAAAAAALALALGGCTWPVGEPDASEATLPPVEAATPADVAVVDAADPAAAAAAASAAFFASSPVVVLAGPDPDDRLAAASIAVALGVPMLLGDAAGGGSAGGGSAGGGSAGGGAASDDDGADAATASSDPTATAPASPTATGVPGETDAPAPAEPVTTADELARLGATHVVNVGAAAPADVVAVIDIDPSDPAGAAAALGIALEAVAVDADPLDAVTDLEPGDGVLLADPAPPEASASPVPTAGDGAQASPTLPEVTRAPPLDTTTLVAVHDPAQLAAVANARAAGASVSFLPADDPRLLAAPDVIEQLAVSDGPVVLAGAAFAAQRSLDWQVRSARTGAQLPGGGQLLFPEHMIVLEYGLPGEPILGILGEQGIDESIARAEGLAAAYEPLTDRTVLPGFEIITTVASGSPTDDGDFSSEPDVETLRPWVEAAADAGLYVVLDLQPGRDSFPTQLAQYAELLEYPWVGLALDPEWRLEPDQRHLRDIGQVEAAEVNEVIDDLAAICDELDLPPKLLVLHQFRTDMLLHRGDVDVDRPEVTVLLHADGQGSQPAKQATWRTLHRDAPEGVAWGWKNFIDEDAPMLTPEQTMQQVDPVPDLVSYQ
ncbi:hypothetical protein [Agromyces sp. SYSU T00194]|uniref:hypothetical protein n=1 Tax=Agromyces chitinivorans TaxID=3158560 RepID=UPI0033997B58